MMPALRSDMKIFEWRNRHSLIWWVGAGISIGAPTGAPLASHVTGAITGAVAAWLRKEWPGEERLHAWVRRRMKKSWGPVLELWGASAPGNRRFMFEQYLGVLEEQVDREQALMFMAFDDLPPNAHHEFLARRIHRGDLVITTNFDGCIERAYREQFPRGHLRPAIRADEIVGLLTAFAARTSGSGRSGRGHGGLVKIHGSLRDADGAPAVDTIQSTIRRIRDAGREGAFGLHDGVAAALENALRGRTMILAGYAGGDDVDINPSWARMHGAGNWHWLVYRSRDRKAARRELKGVKARVKELADMGAILAASTASFGTLDEVGGYPAPGKGASPSLKKRYLDWFRAQSLNEFAPMTLLAMVLQESGFPDDAVKLLGFGARRAARADARVRCVYYKTLGRIALDCGDYAAARAAGRKLVAAARDGRLPVERSAGRQHLAAVALDMGDLRGALSAIDDAIRISRPRAAGSPIGLSHDLNLKASILSEMGETRRAFHCYVESYRLAMAAGDPEAMLMAASNLGLLTAQSRELQCALAAMEPALVDRVATARGDLGRITRPVERFRLETTDLAVGDGRKNSVPNAEADIEQQLARITHPALRADRRVNIGQGMMERGKYAAGLAQIEAALTIYTQQGIVGGVVRCLLIQAIGAYDTGRISDAARFAARGLALTERRYPNGSMRASLLHIRALCRVARGRPDAALADLTVMERLKRRAMEDRELLLCRYTRAQICVVAGRIGEALRLYRSLAKAYRAVDDANGLADVSLQLGNIQAGRGRFTEALERHHEAERLYTECGIPLGAWRARLNQAMTLLRSGRSSEAVALFDRTYRDVPEGAERAEIAQAMRLLIIAAVASDRLEVARDARDHARRRRIPLGLSRGLVRRLAGGPSA